MYRCINSTEIIRRYRKKSIFDNIKMFLNKLCSKRLSSVFLAMLMGNLILCCSYDYEVKIESFLDRYMTGKLMVSKEIMGYQMCVRDCLTRNCNFVNFNKETFRCELNLNNHKNVQDGSEFLDDPGYIAVNVSRLVTYTEEMALQSAELNETEDNYVCITLKTEKISCVKEDFMPLDCKEIRDYGSTEDGVYTLFPTKDRTQRFRAFCELSTDSGGWTVVQRRMNGLTDFFTRDWNEYRDGFGNPADEYWLGNIYIHQITRGRSCELKIDLISWDNITGYALYPDFIIGSENDSFSLSVGKDLGNTGYDHLYKLSGKKFSTWDNYNGKNPDGNCAKRFGAWWYGMCPKAITNLNGDYNRSNENSLHWFRFKHKISTKKMKETTMKVRCV